MAQKIHIIITTGFLHRNKPFTQFNLMPQGQVGK